MGSIVRNLLKVKGNDVWHVSPETSVLDALKLMAEKQIGALLVLEGDQIVGIVSERDFVRKIAQMNLCAVESPVRDYMTTRVIIIKPDNSIDDCMALMTDKHIRHLPVMEGGSLVGMISIGDLVKETIKGHETTIKQLENYITGTGYNM